MFLRIRSDIYIYIILHSSIRLKFTNHQRITSRRSCQTALSGGYSSFMNSISHYLPLKYPHKQVQQSMQGGLHSDRPNTFITFFEDIFQENKFLAIDFPY